MVSTSLAWRPDWQYGADANLPLLLASSPIHLLGIQGNRPSLVNTATVSRLAEGACRHVIKDRMERSGMRWREKSAQAMLNLRCVDSSELWDVATEQHRAISQSKYGKERRNYSEAFLTMAS
jgi:hypothetical protein